MGSSVSGLVSGEEGLLMVRVVLVMMGRRTLFVKGVCLTVAGDMRVEVRAEEVVLWGSAAAVVLDTCALVARAS